MLVVQSIRWLDAKRIVVFRFLPPTPLTIHPSSSLFFSARLLLVAVQSAASLGVEELVPAYVSLCRALPTLPHRRASHHITDSPLDGPLHSGVSGNHRGDEVQDLVPRAAHDVPEALANEGGHGALTVGAQCVGDDALSGSATALVGVTP